MGLTCHCLMINPPDRLLITRQASSRLFLCMLSLLLTHAEIVISKESEASLLTIINVYMTWNISGGARNANTIFKKHLLGNPVLR